MRSENKQNGALRQQRLKRGWSLQRVADAICELSLQLHARQCGANGDMIGEWERGVKVPGPFYRELLCRLYEMDAEQLGFIELPTSLERRTSPGSSYSTGLLVLGTNTMN